MVIPQLSVGLSVGAGEVAMKPSAVRTNKSSIVYYLVAAFYIVLGGFAWQQNRSAKNSDYFSHSPAGVESTSAFLLSFILHHRTKDARQDHRKECRIYCK